MNRQLRAIRPALAVLTAAATLACTSTYTTHYRGYANIDDFRMYYEVHGDGEPVLLLHGGTTSGAESWSRVIPALAPRYRVIVPDSRAHGRSTDSDEPLSYDLLTDNLVELMDHLEIERAHVVGWSDGGVNGLNMAIRHPQRLGKLVAYGANFHANGLPDHAIEWIEELSPETWPAELAELTYLNIAPDPTRMGVMLDKIRTMWLSQPTWTTDDLARIDTPVLILEDSLGNAIRPEHTEGLAAAIPGAELILIDDTDHAAPQEQAGTFNRLVQRFLGR
jgi:pimeloyl-ACP methyl ester carboxylesterase